ncbi:MAG: ABC transporter permease, partial [Rhizobiaceae bacterium]|nr:ABC transporter permease [Rhizobiaceae bacterium]
MSTTTKTKKLEHYVNPAPFDPQSIENMTPEQEAIFLASQKKLMWWKFKKHRVAVFCGGFLLFMYLAILISEILAPYALETRNSKFIYAPPKAMHF